MQCEIITEQAFTGDALGVKVAFLYSVEFLFNFEEEYLLINQKKLIITLEIIRLCFMLQYNKSHIKTPMKCKFNFIRKKKIIHSEQLT